MGCNVNNEKYFIEDGPLNVLQEKGYLNIEELDKDNLATFNVNLVDRKNRIVF